MLCGNGNCQNDNLRVTVTVRSEGGSLNRYRLCSETHAAVDLVRLAYMRERDEKRAAILQQAMELLEPFRQER